jgi:hypothetical protein
MVSFDKHDPSCLARTPIGAALQSEGIYIRAKVQNPKSQMAKSCRAFLVKVEKQNAYGIFEPTIFADSLQLAWSCQQDGGRPIDLPSGVSQFVDVISTDKAVPTAYHVYLSFGPHRYIELFDSKPKTLRLTVLVTGDGAARGQTTIVFKWSGQWDTFEVGSE